MNMLSEMAAATQATDWVRDEVECSTCLGDEDSQRYAEGFVTGFMLGLSKGAAGSLVVQGPPAEAFWRGNLRAALDWERRINGMDDND